MVTINAFFMVQKSEQFIVECGCTVCTQLLVYFILFLGLSIREYISLLVLRVWSSLLWTPSYVNRFHWETNFRGICSRYRLTDTSLLSVQTRDHARSIVQSIGSSDKWTKSVSLRRKQPAIQTSAKVCNLFVTKRSLVYLVWILCLLSGFIRFLELISGPVVRRTERRSSSYLCWNVDERICEITRMTEEFLSERIESSIEIVCRKTKLQRLISDCCEFLTHRFTLETHRQAKMFSLDPAT